MHRHLTLLALPLVLLAACVEEVALVEAPAATPMEPEETRVVELRFLRTDVKGFGLTLGLEEIKAFPPAILDNTWLLDLHAEPLVYNALAQLQATPTDEAYALPTSAHNMWKLLTMTPDNIVLDGTSLGPLLGVGKAVGIPPALILGDLIGVGRNEPAITTELATRAILDNVIVTHPNAQVRRGPVTPAHPDGLYPVAPDSIPVYLNDVVNDFKTLPVSFGPAAEDPADPGAARHPGFVKATSGLQAALDDFSMTVRVDLNALPYKGVDLTDATIGSVNSIHSQVEELFDPADPTWLSIEGLNPDLVIPELTMAIFEAPTFIAGGDARDPAPLGNSPAWQLPPWQFEHLIAHLARLRTAEIPAQCTVYSPQGQVEMPLEAVEVCLADDGWTTITVDDSVLLDTPPPPPSYFWDVLLEVAQVRLHDGGLAEGQGDVELTLRDVPVGVTTEQMVAQIRDNFAANPAALIDIAERVNDTSDGAPDFYYYQPQDPAHPGDWLYFVTPLDIRRDLQNLPARDYSAYTKIGFFADPELTVKLSTTQTIDGDVTHEKIKITEGDTLYIQDDEARRYRLVVGPKPTLHRISLEITRLE
jgi:hypothetical protein